MTFDAEKHEYSDNGVVIPSVTTILRNAGLIDDRWFSAEARDRGSAVHALCERYANGRRYDNQGRWLDSLEYVNAFAAWMKDSGAYLIMSECVIHHTLCGKRYAGKFDGLYEIAGKRILVDVKTGARAKWHPVQLVAYSVASLESGEWVNPDGMMDVYVKADGTYKTISVSGVEMISALETFKEALTK